MSEHVVTPRTYVIIWVVLMLCTALTAGLSEIDLDTTILGHHIAFSAMVAVLIACTKATLIALFFMHMKWASRPTRLVGLAALLWLGIMFVLTSTDFFTRAWATFPNQ